MSSFIFIFKSKFCVCVFLVFLPNLCGCEEVGEKAVADANPGGWTKVILSSLHKKSFTRRNIAKLKFKHSKLTQNKFEDNSKKSHLTGKVKRQQSWWPLGKAQETQASPSITFSSPFPLSRVSWSSQTGEWVPQTSVPGQAEGKTAGREFWVNRYLQQMQIKRILNQTQSWILSCSNCVRKLSLLMRSLSH